MCGIAGFWGLGGRGDIEAMTAAIRHRGPDGEATWSDPERPLHLGHTRLAILDIEGGAQPMWSEDGRYGIVFNGEIYNHGELRSQLEAGGARFRSDHSDTETLLLGYREWGADLCWRLNGMWAFAIVDRVDGTLFLSRDRFGQKPLFYHQGSQLFAFASEATALLAHDQIAAEIDRTSLLKYFGYGFIPSPRSLYRQIHKLPGGCYLKLDLTSGTSQLTRWWSYELEPDEPWSPAAESRWCEQLRELLARSVQRRLMADVPVGVFLSGGIDSSSVTAMAARFGTPQTFAVGFEDPSFDEREQAAQAAAHLKVRHHLEILDWNRGSDLMADVAKRLDEPMGDVSLLPCHLLGQFTSRHVKVALGGDGADELLAGYDPFHALRWANLYSRLIPKPLHRATRLVMSRLPVSHRNMSLDFKIKRTLRGLDHPANLWMPVWMSPLEPAELQDLLGEPIDIEAVYSEAIEAWDHTGGAHLVDRTQMFFTKLYLQDDILVKIDRANMWHGLEARSPFLDIDLVNFLRRLPHDAKYRRGTAKYLLKKAMAGILPDAILRRSKKGFGVPIGRWFHDNGDLKPQDSALPDLNKTWIQQRYTRHRAGRTDDRLFLWCHWLLDRHIREQKGLPPRP